jgi:hypothetical protein
MVMRLDFYGIYVETAQMRVIELSRLLKSTTTIFEPHTGGAKI